MVCGTRAASDQNLPPTNQMRFAFAPDFDRVRIYEACFPFECVHPITVELGLYDSISRDITAFARKIRSDIEMRSFST